MTSIPFLYFAASLAQYTLNPCSRCWKTYLSWEKTDKTCFKRKSVPSNTKGELIVLFCFDFDVLWLKLWSSVYFRFVFRGWISVLNVARFSVVWNSFDKSTKFWNVNFIYIQFAMVTTLVYYSKVFIFDSTVQTHCINLNTLSLKNTEISRKASLT